MLSWDGPNHNLQKEEGGLSLPTVKRVEAGTGPHVSNEARMKLQHALEAGGVEFLPENGGGAGLRLRARKALGAPISARLREAAARWVYCVGSPQWCKTARHRRRDQPRIALAPQPPRNPASAA